MFQLILSHFPAHRTYPAISYKLLLIKEVKNAVLQTVVCLILQITKILFELLLVIDLHLPCPLYLAIPYMI